MRRSLACANCSAFVSFVFGAAPTIDGLYRLLGSVLTSDDTHASTDVVCIVEDESDLARPGCPDVGLIWLDVYPVWRPG
jgi:hypothetical protein